MAEYRKVYKRFWRSPTVRKMCNDEMLLYLYLITGPHSNALGYYELPLEYICADLDWSLVRVKKNMGGMVKAGKAIWDGDARCVMIPDFIRHEQIRNPNQAKHCIALLEDLPVSIPCYELLLKLMDFVGPTAAKLLGGYLETQLHYHLNNNNNTQGVTTPLTASGITGVDIRPPKRGKMTKEQEGWFEDWWSVYPKKKNKLEAQKAYAKAAPDYDSAVAIKEGVLRAAQTEQWRKDGGQFIPFPASWLNKGGWMDEEANPNLRFEPDPARPKL